MKKGRKSRKLLSVVIPAYKAEKFIFSNLERIEDTLQKLNYDYEIICVVDGYVDKTKQNAEKYSENHKKVRVFGYKRNRGKGNAVRFGMAKAKGDIIGFIDDGLEINANAMSMLLAHFEWYNADIIIGSKRHPVSKISYPWQRKILSFGYQMISKVLFNLNVRDTQVGIKFFKREVVKKILPRLLVKKFAFDIEMLAVANYLGYKKIYEAPIDLEMDFSDSTIATKGFVKTAGSMLWDTLAVFYRLRILDFYNYKNRRLWTSNKV